MSNSPMITQRRQMNFSSALRYPFVNFAKVFSIVLVMTIAMALFTLLFFNSFDVAGFEAALDNWVNSPDVSHLELPDVGLGGPAIMGMFGMFAVAVVSGLWLSGYSVSVLRALLRDDEQLPAIQFGRDMIAGLYLLLAGIGYALLFFALIFCEVVVLGFTSGLGSINGFLGMAVFLLTIGAAAVMGWAYFVGMARMAAEGNQRAAWQLRHNMRIARQNWRWGAFLLLYMVLLSLGYGMISSLVGGVFGGFAGAAGATLSIILYYFFQLMQHFSTQHLIAQYALAIGIGDGKAKAGETMLV
ncbi:MAG: DUF4013 domain-containing protein [Chloroflexi bacterium]|nr:DUF4013 domain-containing protein [Chloroflexota bacterium]MXX82658.1 DUF4013 domain-containing protein [Chloroflexota bacterium]MYA92822.1 DUF4013 domain-containing protein [Chloroflexota bacterium]MYC55464.1 DUF4013 domain-containing protein [Chloroflexota bacterium]MYD39354.1 DUF4013 domain-containing protein [Chloroflexota bacterium]